MFYDKLNKFQKLIFIFIASICINFFAINPTYIIATMVAFAIPLTIFLYFRKPYLVVYSLIILILFQNIIAIALAKQMGSTLMQSFIFMKELLAYSSLALAILFNNKKISISLADTFALLFGAILTIYLVIPTEVTIFVKLVQYRQIITPIILYLLGRLLIIKKDIFHKILKFTVNISVITVIFGFIESFLLGDNFWISLGIKDYLSYKGMNLYAFGNNGLPGNFYTFDYSLLIGTSLRRMVSFMADPTLLGQYLVLPIMIVLLTDNLVGKKRIPYLIILLTGLILTLSKGGLFSLLIAFIYKLLKSKYKILGGLLLTNITILTGVILRNASTFSSLPAHLNGLTHNLKLMLTSPLGQGLGKSGNLSLLYSYGNTEDISSGESFIGVILGQLGIFTIIFLLFIHYLIKEVKTTNARYQNISIVIQSTLIGTVTSSFISESAISFLSAGILFLFTGMFSTILQKDLQYRRSFF